MKQNLFVTTILVGATACGMLLSCNSKTDVMQDKALSISDLDTSVSPKDDFYQYATGGWQKLNPLPDEESRFGSFDLLGKGTSQKVKELVVDLAKNDNATGSLEWKIGQFYSVGMDSANIEKLGIDPLNAEFNRIAKISSKDQVVKQFAHNNKYGLGSLFILFASADADNSNMNIAHIHQGGLGLPDRDYYTNTDERSLDIQKEYVNYVAKMFSKLGDDQNTASRNAETVMAIETNLAKHSMTRLAQRDPHAVNNKMSIDDLQKLTGNFNFNLFFHEIGLNGVNEVNVRQPEFFKFIGQIIDEVNIDDWKTYFRWKLINGTADMLSSDFDKECFDFYGKFLKGQEKQKARWRRMVASTNAALGEAVGKKFVEKHFPAESKARMEELVANLKVAFAQRVEASSWMSKETQEKALEKLSSIIVKIGYPDTWRDYSALEITDSHVQNVFNSNVFDFNYMLAKVGKPVDKAEWQMTPQTVNAYYSPETNEICFPAGILQPPFFYMDADDAVNYGAIGVVIGHEMTHGFDDQGRNFDKDGNLKDWWTKEDAESFQVEANILIDRYNEIVVLDTVHADGNLSLGENIADFGGLTISYQAFQNSMKGKEKPAKISGFTPEQRFFLAYSKVWAQNIRDKEILRRTKEDVHSLGEWRVNGQLPGVEAFHKAFDVKEGDAMYISKDKWTRIW